MDNTPNVKPGISSSEVQAFPLVGIFVWLVSNGYLHIDDPHMKLLAIALGVLAWVVMFVGRTWLKAHNQKGAFLVAIAEAQADALAAYVAQQANQQMPLPPVDGQPAAAAPAVKPADVVAALGAVAQGVAAATAPAPANPPPPSP